MLDSLDTFLAFAVTMLGLSLVITCLTQMTSSLLGARGANLRDGLVTLLATLEPQLAASAQTITDRVLTHPLISDSIFACLKNVPIARVLVRRWQLASAIGASEFKRILNLSFPTTSGAGASGATVRSAVNSLLANPDFDAWFDTTMARLSARFSLSMRLWTVLFAILLAFGGHIDSARLFTTLWRDAGTRARLVAVSDRVLQAAERIQAAAPSADMKQLAGEVEQIQNTLGIRIVPSPYPGLDYSKDSLPGLVLTVLFLSLGAPFWYNTLKRLTNLRPVLAEKREG
jgi:hypothetical protein